MIPLILILIAFAGGWYFGAKKGLPDFLKKEDNEEKYFFLSLLNAGDEITIRAKHVHEMTDKVTVLRNEPSLKAIILKENSWSDDFTLAYTSERLSEVVEDNLILARDKFNKIK